MSIPLLSVFSSHSPLFQPYNHRLIITGLSPSISNHSPHRCQIPPSKASIYRVTPHLEFFSGSSAHKMQSKLLTPVSWPLPISQPLLPPMADPDYTFHSLFELKQTDECALPLCSAALPKTLQLLSSTSTQGRGKSLDMGVKHLGWTSTCLFLVYIFKPLYAPIAHL